MSKKHHALAVFTLISGFVALTPMALARGHDSGPGVKAPSLQADADEFEELDGDYE